LTAGIRFRSDCTLRFLHDVDWHRCDGDKRIKEVTLRWARLVLGWVTVGFAYLLFYAILLLRVSDESDSVESAIQMYI